MHDRLLFAVSSAGCWFACTPVLGVRRGWLQPPVAARGPSSRAELKQSASWPNLAGIRLLVNCPPPPNCPPPI